MNYWRTDNITCQLRLQGNEISKRFRSPYPKPAWTNIPRLKIAKSKQKKTYEEIVRISSYEEINKILWINSKGMRSYQKSVILMITFLIQRYLNYITKAVLLWSCFRNCCMCYGRIFSSWDRWACMLNSIAQICLEAVLMSK